MTTQPPELELRETISQLTARVDALEESAGHHRLSIGVMSGNLDTTIAAFIIALGAVAYDMEVDIAVEGLTRYPRPRATVPNGPCERTLLICVTA